MLKESNDHKFNFISDNYNNSIKLLNSNVDKRFFNYYFNDNSNNNENKQINNNSVRKFYNLTPEDKEEFKKKFDHDLYLK